MEFDRILKEFSRQTSHALVRPSDLAEIPKIPGAYVLALHVEKPFLLAIRTLPKTRMLPGVYFYCGSAFGPGGLMARLARHFRKRKSPHWHIDRLTGRAASCAALIAPGGDECALARQFHKRLNLDIPVPGFGASDCRKCRSHLFVMRHDWPDE